MTRSVGVINTYLRLPEPGRNRTPRLEVLARPAPRARGARLRYDTPTDPSGGVETFDDTRMLQRQDGPLRLQARRQEGDDHAVQQLPLQLTQAADDLLKPNLINPDLVRWELHRVWVVEATLKPGKRHIYSKRTFYLDEDWGGGWSTQYDAAGKLWRGIRLHDAELRHAGADMRHVGHYDLVNGMYAS